MFAAGVIESKAVRLRGLFLPGLLLATHLAWAQLPTARLLTIFPPGARIRSTCEVTVAGVDLDEAKGLWFSHSNITGVVQTNAGRFAVSIGTNVLVGIYEGRVIGRFGISNPRAFAVGTADEVMEAQNDSVTNAMEISLGSTVNGRAEANAVDYFKFRATNGQQVVIRCEAAALDSRMDPCLVLYDGEGRESKQSRRGGVLEFTAAHEAYYVLKVHDFLFGGGNEHFYRLSFAVKADSQVPGLAGNGVAEASDNDKPDKAQVINPPCEVAGQFYPGADVDCYSFAAKKGDVYWVEVFSHRLGLPTDPFILINDQEFNDIEANAGGVEFRTNSRDALGRFEAKEDGVCRLQVRDLFNRTVSDPRHVYRLIIRKEAPDFQLIAMPQGPPPKKDAREAFVWTSVLRQGETIPIKVMALRQDGFKGEISMQATDLPSGVTSSELLIPGDKNSGTLLLTASEAATNWAGAISIVGKGGPVLRQAKAAAVLWNVPDYNTEPVRSRLVDGFTLAVCNEAAPITIETTEAKVFEIPAAGKLAIPLKIIRRGEFNEAFKLKAQGVPTLDSLKEIEIKEKGTNASVELDLTQQKLSPGSYSFYLQGQTKGKYQSPIETDKAKTKDVTITVYSAPIVVKVSPPQTAAK